MKQKQISLSLVISCLVFSLWNCATFAAETKTVDIASNTITNVAQLIERFSLRSAKTPSKASPLWRRPQKVVVWNSLHQIDQLRAQYPDIHFVVVKNSDELTDEIKDADAYIGYCIGALKSLKTHLSYIQSMSVGVENCAASDDLITRNVLVSNIKKLSGPEIAEHAIALMMALTRGLDVFQRAQIKQQWGDELLPGDAIWELEGRTLLVVGLGGIGEEVARRAHGLGMNVIATRNSRREGPDYVSYVGLSNELNQLAAKADVVINTVPLTDETRGMFDKAFFKAMQKHSYFISVGRGRSTNTDDLVDALKSGEIAGAGLDVMDPEPLPEDHPLWNQPRVIITPHIAARSEKLRDRVWLLVEENFRRYVNGEALLSPVNLQAGY